jgi:hypothetical protein
MGRQTNPQRCTRRKFRPTKLTCKVRHPGQFPISPQRSSSAPTPSRSLPTRTVAVERLLEPHRSQYFVAGAGGGQSTALFDVQDLDLFGIWYVDPAEIPADRRPKPPVDDGNSRSIGRPVAESHHREWLTRAI